MNEIFCECGHSINKHYLDRPSDGDAVGYCTHYDEKKHVFCSCQKSSSDIASEQIACITVERDKLFQLAVLTFKALEDIGLILTPNARALDSACANLSPELWERIDVEASK